MADSKVNLVFEGNDDALNRTLMRLENRLEAVTKKLGKVKTTGTKAAKGVGDEMDKTKKKVAGAFGPNAVGQMKRFALALGGIAGATLLARKAFTELARARTEALAAARAAAPTRGALAQVAGGDPFKLGVLQAEATKSRTQFGLNADEAEKLQFALQSAGLGVQFDDSRRAKVAGKRIKTTGQRELFAGLKNVTEAAGVAGAVQTLVSAFPGEKKAPRKFLDQLFAASAVSPALIEEFGPAVAKPAQPVQLIGGSSAEALGSVAILAKAAGTSEAATQIARLADVIGKKGAGGNTGLIAGVRALSEQTKGLTPAELIEFIPEVRARRGFLGIQKNFPEIVQTIADVERAGTQLTRRQRARGELSTTERIVQTVRGSGQIESVRKLQAAEQRRAVKEEEAFAGPLARTETAVAQVGERAVDDSGLGRLIRNVVAGTVEFFGGSEGAVLAADFMLTGRGDLIGERIDAHNRLEQAATQLNGATQNLNGGPTLARPDVDK